MQIQDSTYMYRVYVLSYGMMLTGKAPTLADAATTEVLAAAALGMWDAKAGAPPKTVAEMKSEVKRFTIDTSK